MPRLRRLVGFLFLAGLPACAVASSDGGVYEDDGSDPTDGVDGILSTGGKSMVDTHTGSGGALTGGAHSGGAPHSGGTSSGGASTGGASSGGTSSGGDTASGGDESGGASSGGASSSGGAASGGASSGGAGSGGAASGGAGTGGAGTGGGASGSCASLPTYAEWKVGSGQMTGDQVVYACTVAQAGCSGKMTGVDYLWECNQSHVPNCTSQDPQSGTSWTFVADCE